mmetsp:Transcript_48715/g.114360  ORF Transcript_48715/g.114360 Transcript_48715/m.114360 type:complete len:107 (-) Transcript_48715:85-405(-)
MANLEAQDLMRGTVIMAGDTLPPFVRFRMIFSDATHDKVEFLSVIDGLTSLVHDEGTVMCFHDVSHLTKFVPVAWADAELRKRLRVVAGPVSAVICSCFEVFPLAL